MLMFIADIFITSLVTIYHWKFAYATVFVKWENLYVMLKCNLSNPQYVGYTVFLRL